MDRESRRRFEEYRQEAGPVENTLIDELFDGEVDRGEFIRRGTMVGLSASVIGTALAALGEAPLAFAKSSKGRAGGRIRVGCIPPPAHGLDPHTYADTGSLVTGNIAGEMLNRTTFRGTLVPELALSWSSNAAATIWTYKLRQGVKFQNGQAMSAGSPIPTAARRRSLPTRASSRPTACRRWTATRSRSTSTRRPEASRSSRARRRTRRSSSPRTTSSARSRRHRRRPVLSSSSPTHPVSARRTSRSRAGGAESRRSTAST